MFIEVSGVKYRNDEKAYCSWSRYDLKNFITIKFSYNRFSNPTEKEKWMGAFGVFILTDHDNWESVFTIAKNSDFDNSFE